MWGKALKTVTKNYSQCGTDLIAKVKFVQTSVCRIFLVYKPSNLGYKNASRLRDYRAPVIPFYSKLHTFPCLFCQLSQMFCILFADTMRCPILILNYQNIPNMLFQQNQWLLLLLFDYRVMYILHKHSKIYLTQHFLEQDILLIFSCLVHYNVKKVWEKKNKLRITVRWRILHTGRTHIYSESIIKKTRPER